MLMTMMIHWLENPLKPPKTTKLIPRAQTQHAIKITSSELEVLAEQELSWNFNFSADMTFLIMSIRLTLAFVYIFFFYLHCRRFCLFVGGWYCLLSLLLLLLIRFAAFSIPERKCQQVLLWLGVQSRLESIFVVFINTINKQREIREKGYTKT